MSDQIGDRLQALVDKTGRDPDLAGLVVRIERQDDGFAWTGSVGELDPTTRFFIASTTKLYTTAIMLRLAERRSLGLEDRLVDHGGTEWVQGLHVMEGIDYTDRITLRQLLAHTSGLPDYFLGKRQGAPSLEKSIRSGVDSTWTLEDVVDMARELGPVFPPGTPGKARYADTNFQLLGRVIEHVTGLTFANALRAEILEPLRLEHTWLYTDPADIRPLSLRDRSRQLHIPMAMASFGPDGGLVTPVGDLMRFLRGFFEGGLFDPAVLDTLKTYNRIFFPLQYGVGFARLKLPRALSPFAAQPELLGHSGLSGAFAFLAPEQGIYLAGTVNNIAKPGRSFRLMLRLLQALGTHQTESRLGIRP